MLSKEELSDDFEFPAYSSDSSNNGIIGFTNNPEFICDDITPVYITFGDHTRTVNIAKKSFSVLDNVKVLKPFTSNEKYLLFIISSWKKQIPNLGYARHWKVARNCKIQLPLKENALAFSNPCDNVKNIDFDFMESFIRELEEERIRELNAYLLATGLKDYALSAEEEKALEAFKTVQWGEYRIGDLYKKLDLHNKDFDKREDTASEPTKEYSLPIVNAKHGDNGIMFYGKEDIFDSAEMTIDIVQNGAVATGDVYPQPQRTGILWDAYLIKALDHTDSKETLFFITSSIQKSIKQKFCYEFKATWDRVQREKIYLPTKNNKPDYATMETFIKAVEKLVIKDVVLYADSKIKATKNVVKKDFEYKINEDAGLLHVADSIN
ncbi:MAG: restriction endonuclease subunit S [Spirochaetia bacterium]|nr:restriction endonuclease subunit S [Spirochaetia bacterium]